VKTDNVTLGKRLKELIKQNGFSQRQLCEKLGIMPNTLTNYVLGKRTPPFDLVVKIAEICRFRLEDLVQSSNQSESSPSVQEAIPGEIVETKVGELYALPLMAWCAAGEAGGTAIPVEDRDTGLFMKGTRYKGTHLLEVRGESMEGQNIFKDDRFLISPIPWSAVKNGNTYVVNTVEGTMVKEIHFGTQDQIILRSCPLSYNEGRFSDIHLQLDQIFHVFEIVDHWHSFRDFGKWIGKYGSG